MTGLSNKAGVIFGKVGRPPNDPVRERLRIYRAAGPLILEYGVRGMTMQAVADAAWLSPGGIYHYFDSKHDLVLYGLTSEALSRACTDASQELHKALASEQCPSLLEVVELYADKNVRMLELVRPALQAAVELGRPELRARLSTGIRGDADFLIPALNALYPTLKVADEAADSIRRTILGLAVDESSTVEDARNQLRWLFRRLLPELAGSTS